MINKLTRIIQTEINFLFLSFKLIITNLISDDNDHLISETDTLEAGPSSEPDGMSGPSRSLPRLLPESSEDEEAVEDARMSGEAVLDA